MNLKIVTAIVLFTNRIRTFCPPPNILNIYTCYQNEHAFSILYICKKERYFYSFMSILHHAVSSNLFDFNSLLKYINCIIGILYYNWSNEYIVMHLFFYNDFICFFFQTLPLQLYIFQLLE